MNNQLASKLRQWRRDFHQYPETGFLEMRTASIVAAKLDELGFDLQIGREVMSAEHCMGRPDKDTILAHYQWALNNGGDKRFLDRVSKGYTGIVATMDTGEVGPTIAYRFDMDALDIHESDKQGHYPTSKGFRSTIPNKMHACGHDAHTSIGLGLASLIAAHKNELKGEIKLIFQPAEEGTRGAKSMVEANIVDDVDYFVASHIGMGVPHNHFVAANNGYLATSKIDVSFVGKASHAGAQPQDGKNALLAASTAVLNIYAISRHADGASRVNVGELNAGTGRNIIPNKALLKVETRGETSAINEYTRNRVEQIVSGAALMYDVEYDIQVVGEAISSKSSESLALVLQSCADEHTSLEETTLYCNDATGSEDATYFMERVKKHGGQACYSIFGTELAAGHHNEAFDINEDSLLVAVETLFASVRRLSETTLR